MTIKVKKADPKSGLIKYQYKSASGEVMPRVFQDTPQSIAEIIACSVKLKQLTK